LTRHECLQANDSGDGVGQQLSEEEAALRLELMLTEPEGICTTATFINGSPARLIQSLARDAFARSPSHEGSDSLLHGVMDDLEARGQLPPSSTSGVVSGTPTPSPEHLGRLLRRRRSSGSSPDPFDFVPRRRRRTMSPRRLFNSPASPVHVAALDNPVRPETSEPRARICLTCDGRLSNAAQVPSVNGIVFPAGTHEGVDRLVCVSITPIVASLHMFTGFPRKLNI